MTGDFTAVRAERRDAESIVSLMARYVDCAWTLEQVIDEIQNPDALFFVVRDGENTVGFLSGVCAADECELSDIAVESAYHRRGIATALFEKFFSEAKVRGIAYIYLLVRDGNGPAQSLYSRLGFEPTGRRVRYYGDADAVIMRCRL